MPNHCETDMYIRGSDEDVTAFANRANHVEVAFRRIVQPREITDVVPGVVQGGTNQRVHAGIQTNAAHAIFLYYLRGRRQQDAALRNKETAGLDHDRVTRERRFHFFQGLRPTGQIKFTVVG